jgi:beta-mannosidase
LIVISLERNGTEVPMLLSQCFRLPAGRPVDREPADRLGLRATARALGGDLAQLTVSARRFAYGVRVSVPGYEPDDDAFCIEPGHQRELRLRRVSDEASLAGSIGALNLIGRVSIVEEAGE